ncbi:hypothetical protein POV27_06365 [Aureisphaera galaxeae]|uniref:hypothetical protein n=1 Tax=Aureisphaera galaxeae TaxID=1538023 RepID=UPI0023509F5E|nr:hypothetical protein [Aureisphaera galaxeae]MDC8003668.1 hypothetical protein [Aureisphaera galaxeae]
MRLLFFFVGVFLSFWTCSAQVSPTQLLADIDQLEELIETKHIRPYRLVSKKKLASVIQEAKDYIGAKEACDETCYVALLKIVAALRDGHSVVRTSSREKLFGFMPLTVTWFKEGLYVTRVPDSRTDLLGSRLEAINDVPIDEVLDKIRTVLPHGNDSRFKKFAYAYLRMPGLLYGLGITNDADRASFTLSKNNKTVNAVFENMTDEAYEQTTFVHFDDLAEKIPIYRKNYDDYYWFRYDADLKIFYCNYKRVGTMEKERVSQFANRMWGQVDSLEVDKFVFDIRNNGGGQFARSMAFIQGILDRPKINAPGKLFIISGYDTFSAALDLLRKLEVKSNATIIGEPPGDYAASSGDPKSYTLENTGIEVQLSSVFHPSVFPNDMRPKIPMDQFIEISWEEYSKGEDAAYHYIVNYNTQIPEKASSDKYTDYLGRYHYDEDRHLILESKNGHLQLEISESLTTPIYTGTDGSLTTEVKGLSVQLGNGVTVLRLPDGTAQSFHKTEDEKAAIEYLYEGNIEKAGKLYRDIKSNNPKSRTLRDGAFSNHALFAYFKKRSEDRTKASEIAKGILKLGIELNEGDAPFCEFALRFY